MTCQIVAAAYACRLAWMSHRRLIWAAIGTAMTLLVFWRIWMLFSGNALPATEAREILVLLVSSAIIGGLWTAHREMPTEKARRQLAEAKASYQLVTAVSHEIRTPLQSILGYLEMLEDPNPQTQRQALAAVRRSGQHLHGLINDLLDFSRLESGRLRMAQEYCLSTEILRDALELAGGLSREKKLLLELHALTAIPELVATDPMRLRQILVNLLSNAIKFTPAGGRVTLETSFEAGEKEGRWLLAVRDSGSGMNPEDLARIFEPFVQVTQDRDLKMGGSGLGLAICRELTRLLNGTLEVSSQPGRGSCFQLTLPVGASKGRFSQPSWKNTAASQASVAPLAAEILTLTGTILLVEDTADARDLMALHLQRAGAHVLTAHDGHEACQMALGSSVDLILMDLQLPGCDGWQATRQLRQAGFAGPIIACSANITERRSEEYQAGGFTQCLEKPVAREELLQVVRGLMHRPANRVSLYDGDPQMAALVRRFAQALPRRLVEMEKYLLCGELEAFRSQVHKLKGSAGAYGFPAISESAAELEKALYQHQPQEILVAILDKLRKA